MASQRVSFTTPVGRVVLGSLYKPNTTDAEGKPLVVKTGPNAGQPRSNFFFALAIPKGAETHWSQTVWGALIYGVGVAAFPQAAQSPTFAWKIEDGDSLVPNKRGRKPIDNEGWKGNWILKFSGGFALKVYRNDAGGYVQVTEDGYIKPGYFVEVAGTVDGNGSQSQPGIYLNHGMVCFRAFGPEIAFGPDVNDAGFGQSPLPVGATLTPPPSALPMPTAQFNQASIMPQPQFLSVPTAQALPTTSTPVPAVPVAPIPTVPVFPSSGFAMTAKAAGASHQAFQAAGWTDANLIEQGYMTV